MFPAAANSGGSRFYLLSVSDLGTCVHVHNTFTIETFARDSPTRDEHANRGELSDGRGNTTSHKDGELMRTTRRATKRVFCCDCRRCGGKVDMRHQDCQEVHLSASKLNISNAEA